MRKALVEEVLPALLGAIARFCLKHSVSIRELLDASKRAFLLAAQEELERRQEKISVTRLSLLTGMHRVEIPKLLNTQKTVSLERPHFLSRIISIWETNPAYLDKTRIPKVLSINGNKSDFYKLVWSLGKSVHPSSILKEMVRLQLAERTEHGLRLIKSSAVPVEGMEGIYLMLSKDFLDLYRTVDQHVDNKGGPYNLHIRTEYDNIYRSAVPEIREWIEQEGRRFHARIREFLASKDKDLNPTYDDEAGCKIVVTSFSQSPQIKNG